MTLDKFIPYFQRKLLVIEKKKDANIGFLAETQHESQIFIYVPEGSST